MIQLMQADAQLVDQMYFVAKELRMFYEKHRRFPREGTEMENFKASLLRKLANPYRPRVTDEYYNTARPEDAQPHLYIVTDGGITLEGAKEYRVNPPASWTADPGTIMVIINGEGTYWIWGASADRLPVRNPETNKTRLFARDVRREMEKRDLAAQERRRQQAEAYYGQ